METAKVEISAVRNRLAKYSAHEIYNVDVTALCYKSLPNRTYVLKSENNKYLRGIKKMKAKDRVSAYLCTNTDGSHKIPITIIGKSRNPRAFRKQKPSCYYLNSAKAWSTAQLFGSWLHKIFAPFFRSRTTSDVPLLLENASSRSKICVPKGIEIIFLPPNVTSIHQPADMSIIRAWKTGYRRLMLRSISEDLDSRLERRYLNKNRLIGLNGLKEGSDSNMLDVCKLSVKAWDMVNMNAVARC